MKSALQQRAEAAAARFHTARKPIDASGARPDGPRRTAERRAGVVLDWIEEQLDEEILAGRAGAVGGRAGNRKEWTRRCYRGVRSSPVWPRS